MQTLNPFPDFFSQKFEVGSSISLFSFVYFLGSGKKEAGVHSAMPVYTSEDNLQDLVFSFHQVASGDWLRWPGLAVSAGQPASPICGL